eukprot:1670899-Pleurochrysis_carterae.AAC.1
MPPTMSSPKGERTSRSAARQERRSRRTQNIRMGLVMPMARLDVYAPAGRGTMIGRCQMPPSSCFLPITSLARLTAR